MADYNVIFDQAQDMQVTFTAEENLDVNYGPGVFISDYDGPYSVTPSAEEQTLSTRNKTLESDITINPIPSNYGLITWDGTTITVS